MARSLVTAISNKLFQKAVFSLKFEFAASLVFRSNVKKKDSSSF